jgi:hypothetical protein
MWMLSAGDFPCGREWGPLHDKKDKIIEIGFPIKIVLFRYGMGLNLHTHLAIDSSATLGTPVTD